MLASGGLASCHCLSNDLGKVWQGAIIFPTVREGFGKVPLSSQQSEKGLASCHYLPNSPSRVWQAAIVFPTVQIRFGKLPLQQFNNGIFVVKEKADVFLLN